MVKKLFATKLFLTILFFSKVCIAQLYTLDLTDTSTYSVTCGTITPAHWTTKNNSCSITTSEITWPSTSTIPASVVLEGAAMDATDSSVIQHSINGGAWITDTVIYAAPGTFTASRSFNIFANAGDKIRIRVTNTNNAITEKWRIFDGNIKVGTGVLPIELSDFSAKATAGKIKIDWTTASEKNVSFFTVEVGKDGINFEPIATVTAAGNSNVTHSYTVYDENPNYGISYYRLKETDFNGTVQYLKVASVRYDMAASTEFTVYPNPCNSDNIYIRMTGCKENELLVVLYDPLGNEIFSKVVLQQNGQVLTAIDPTNKLQPGIYLVIGSSKNEIYHQRLIVR